MQHIGCAQRQVAIHTVKTKTNSKKDFSSPTFGASYKEQAYGNVRIDPGQTR